MFFLKKIFRPKQRKSDRRRTPRVEARNLIRIDFQTIDTSRIIATGTVKDISLGGIRFATFAPLKKGIQLDGILHFNNQFPGPKKIPMMMRVVRVYKPMGSRRYRVGVSFSDSLRYAQEKEIVRQVIEWLRQSLTS